MKPLKIYTRTTILISAVLAAVMLVVVYFFISARLPLASTTTSDSGWLAPGVQPLPVRQPAFFTVVLANALNPPRGDFGKSSL